MYSQVPSDSRSSKMGGVERRCGAGRWYRLMLSRLVSSRLNSILLVSTQFFSVRGVSVVVFPVFVFVCNLHPKSTPGALFSVHSLFRSTQERGTVRTAPLSELNTWCGTDGE